jgi:5-methylcytosine-specific restriction endonuclease McrA
VTQHTLCPRCGEENDSNQSYCRPCMSAYRKARREKLQPTISCGTCGKAFTKTRSRQLYCSLPCKREPQYAAKRVTATCGRCLHCGDEFVGRSDKKFCSKECGFSAWNGQDYNKQQRARAKRAKAREVAANRPPRITKSAEEIRAYRSEWKRINRLRATATEERRRVAKRNAPTVDFTHEELKARFSMWAMTCWMCGRPATAMDHVKPISAGGSHMLANLRPACSRCNSSKGGRWFGVAKLSLFMRA